MNLGIDFGSTYTIVSLYDEHKGVLDALLLGGMTSPCIPTMAAERNDKLEFGVVAKNRTGKKDWKTYKGFKMLLSETDQNKLRQRGYSQEENPVTITQSYLENLIQNVIDKCGDERIENMVVGAPEVWFQEMNTLSGRALLRDICKNLPNVNKDGIKIVSEPACASAFFAYNYMMIRKQPFSGHILLIDYGGGTLDINLTSIVADRQKDGQQLMEIKVLESTGAGENTEGKLGQAGILYMETLAERALVKAGVWEADQPPVHTEKFYRFVNEIEESIVTQTSEIRKQFKAIGNDMEELEETEFENLEFGDEEVSLSYATLLEVYNEVIRDVLQRKLEEMKEFIRKYNIDTNDESFKIALVGGFGNFYLVRRQVEEAFTNSSASISMKDIIQREEDREKAISYGAALFASGIIGIRQTAPYGIGMYNDTISNPEVYYAFRYKQDIEYDTPYYIKGADQEPMVFVFASNSVDRFAINMNHGDETALGMRLAAEFRDELSNLIDNKYKTAIVGFSLDTSEVLRMHLKEFDLGTGNYVGDDKIIELAKFSELFGNQPVEPIYPDKYRRK